VGVQTVVLGSFTVGEVPPTLEYQFLDAAGVPISLVGFTVARFNWGLWLGGTPSTGSVTKIATVSDALNGRVTYAWDGDEFASPGRHAGQFFVNDGITQYASLVIEWQVCAAVGAAPAV
jgi:hypothetical protein